MSHYCAIFSKSDHLVEFAESYNDADHYGIRCNCLISEAQSRGGDWSLYRGDTPFDWDLVDHQPTPIEKAKVRQAEILAELSALDSKSLRSLRAIASGTSTPTDEGTLSALESEAQALREEYATLSDSIATLEAENA